MKCLLILACLMMLATSSPQYVGKDPDLWGPFRGIGRRGAYVPSIYMPHMLRRDEGEPGVYIPHMIRRDQGEPGVYIPHMIRRDQGQPGVYIPHMIRRDQGQPGVEIPHSPGRVISMDYMDRIRPPLTADTMAPGVTHLDPRATIRNEDMMDMVARGWLGKLLKHGKKVLKVVGKEAAKGAGEGAVGLLGNLVLNPPSGGQ